jgi:hypothetical protein
LGRENGVGRAEKEKEKEKESGERRFEVGVNRW